MGKKMILLVGLLMFLSMDVQAQPNETQNKETRTTVERFFSYMGQKNPDKIASLVAENVDWYIFESRQFPWTGQRNKRSEISGVFQTLFSYFAEGKDRFELESLLIDGHEAAVFATLGRQFKSSGKEFTMLVAIHFKVENGLITRFCLYEQTPILEKAFSRK